MQKAVIFDIDKTIADLEKFDEAVFEQRREPSLMNKFLGFASPIPQIIKFLKHAADHFEILFVTARSEDTRKETIDWLTRHVGIGNFKLFMRPGGDNRDADVMKSQLLKLNIEPDFDVQFAVDDSPANRNMYRRHGIPAVNPEDIKHVVGTDF